MVTQPIEYEACLSKRGEKEMPAVVVFQTPPPAVATYQVLGWPGWIARSMIRPEVMAGPIPRSESPSKVSAFRRSLGSSFFSALAAGAAWTPPASRRHSRAVDTRVRFTRIPPDDGFRDLLDRPLPALGRPRFYALPFLRNHTYTGSPRTSSPSPASDSRGLSTRVFPISRRQARMNRAGTTG